MCVPQIIPNSVLVDPCLPKWPTYEFRLFITMNSICCHEHFLVGAVRLNNMPCCGYLHNNINNKAVLVSHDINKFTDNFGVKRSYMFRSQRTMFRLYE